MNRLKEHLLLIGKIFNACESFIREFPDITTVDVLGALESVKLKYFQDMIEGDDDEDDDDEGADQTGPIRPDHSLLPQ
jgi:hypothetical protein